jgi:polygalacturonase
MVVKNLYIYNFPVHCFYTSGAQNLLMENIVLNNTLGDVPNRDSDGKAAGHNTDGFGFASSDNVIVRNTAVYNQDDCIAVTSGNNITAHDLFCSGGHGLSIGSIGGKSSEYSQSISPMAASDDYPDNTVTNISFRDSVLVNQQNGIRIKSNSGTTGKISE